MRGTTAMLAPGTAGQVLRSNGIAPPTWTNAGAGDMLLGTAQRVTAAKTFGDVGNSGNLIVAGNTSGQTVINASPVAAGTAILPPNGGVLVTENGIEMLNKQNYNESYSNYW
jgi:hypothetical protein